MCSATVGASLVNRCTCAASLTRSNAFRGAPGCGKTRNLVPESPYAQDGTSIAWRSRSVARVVDSALTLVASFLSVIATAIGSAASDCELGLEVEDLAEGLERLIGAPAQLGEERSHRLLPPRRHRGSSQVRLP